ncbi:MAG: hypothetical protein JRN45_00725 [Nitrososphaerota archaeon]|nr:hypothetical protein [Nitrososphaerota archaeon]
MAKSAISVTLPTDLISWLDEQIEQRKFRSRAEAVARGLQRLKAEAEGIEFDEGLAERGH